MSGIGKSISAAGIGLGGWMAGYVGWLLLTRDWKHDQMRIFFLLLAATFTLAAAGCGGEPTPEERIRAYIDQVAEAAEARKLRLFDDFVADGYEDERGLTKSEVLGIIARYILANQRIHILKRVASIRVDDAHHAQAVVYAAMAGQPVSGPEDLARITADFYRFEIDLSAGKDGVFRVTRGDWRPTGPEQFLIGR